MSFDILYLPYRRSESFFERYRVEIEFDHFLIEFTTAEF